jgi:putative membrane-bound dehydrogenase-like protein
LAGLWAATAWSGEVVTQKVDLLEVIKAGEVEFHLNPKMDFHDDPKDIWTFGGDGALNVSGRGYGYVGTKKAYRDYHLVLEFKWGTKTWGAREKKAKDNGVLLHGYGPHGAYGGTWMASIEAQIIEGGVGDILVLSPKLADGTELTTSLSAEFGLDRDKEKIWRKGEPRQVVTKGRINWKGRDEDWADRVGFRGREDVESPAGEWNRLEVIAKGDTLQYFVNGALVNEAFDCKPSEGKILLQTEGAEMIVRRYELWPLGAFEEKWSAIQASGGSDVTVRDGQERALSAEESMKLIQLDGDYEVQLVAAEPLVLDPVECTWDEKGRMFVADMRDYPLGPPKAGDPWLSRIQMLTDEDGDGRMDKAVTFADHLDNVQGLLPFDGGLIATTRSQILFLKDTDGNDVADVMKPLIRGFNPKHSQLQVSAPRWGPDGCVHFNNGLEAKEIYPADAPDKVVGVPGSNFKWDPRTGEITPTGGKGQYGGAFDDWGHHFYCSNRNPVMFTVMPYESLLRNPHAGITQNYEDIALPGAATRVYPLKITHTTADAHAGTNTACSGLGVYRGGLMPELRNNVFVPDPTGQLVTRYRVEPNGASLKATRVGERTEFFRSADEWCRPVNFTTGPDGAIYVCDIYRRWIDHARFFPEEFVKTHDMRQGENEGRIWRVVPKGTREGGLKLGQGDGKMPSLPVAEEHAERALFLRIPTITDARELAGILTKHADDAWMAKMVGSAAGKRMGQILGLLGDEFFGTFSEVRSATVRAFAAGAVADGEMEDVKALLALLQRQPGELLWWKPALLQGLVKLPKGHAEAEREIGALQSKIDVIVMDAKAPLEQRLAVLPLLGSRKWAAVEPVMRGLLAGGQSAEVSGAAVALLKRFAATSTAPLIYELLPKVGPAVKRELVPILTANAATALALFKRMDKGEFPTAWVDVETRWRYQRGAGEMAVLAKKLFGEASGDRAGVVSDYMASATTMKGDAGRGKQVFAMVCTACHKHGDLGVDVGPPLADVKVKPPEALLSDILDPNRMFEARWSAYQIDTKDGRILSGLVTAESADHVTVAMMGGATETLARGAIKEMKSLDRTLMPVGLEAAITKEQMADLLAFLGGK